MAFWTYDTLRNIDLHIEEALGHKLTFRWRLHDTKLTEGERLVRHLWHYTPFSVGKTSKTHGSTNGKQQKMKMTEN